MAQITTNCSGCGQRMVIVMEKFSFSGGMPQFFCKPCEKKKEITARFSNIIGEPLSVAFLKRLEGVKNGT